MPQGTGSPEAGVAGARRLQLIGALAAALSIYLPWISAGGDSVNAHEISAMFLLDYDTTNRGVEAGLLLLVAAGIVLADLFVRSPTLHRVATGAAIAVIVIPALFLVQMRRLTSATQQSFGDLLGIGSFVTIAVGIALTVLLVRSSRVADSGPSNAV